MAKVNRIILVLVVVTVALWLLGVVVVLIPDKGGDFLGSSLGLHFHLALGLIALSLVPLSFTIFFALYRWSNRERLERPPSEAADNGVVKEYDRTSPPGSG